jgi:serine protease Do
VAGGVGIALVSAAIASAGTVGLLAAGGWLGEPTMVGGALDTSSQPPTQIRYVDRPDTTRIAAEVTPAIVTVVIGPTVGDPVSDVVTQAGTTAVVASGIVFDKSGWIITNRHAVCGAGTIVVLLDDGRQLAAQVYGLDTLTDLAIIRVEASGLTAADIGDSASLRPGQLSMVIGSSIESLTPSVSSGVVSALGRDLLVTDPCDQGERRALRNVIQTDARVADGSSGGALVNGAGAVVGISVAISADAGDASFAIPINIAKPIMEQAIDGKPLSRPWMGITYTALSPSIAQAHGLSIDHGAWLRDSADGTLPAVVPGGPADLAGLQEGDVVTAIDDQRIDASHSLDDILSQYRPEDQDPIEVWVLRDGTPVELPLTLGTRSEGS